MQFLVPQFIDTEDKIFGPISTRQFVVILIGFTFIYIAYKLSTLWLFMIELVVILGLTIVFAFVKINGQQFQYFILNLVQTLRKPRLKIWLKAVSDSQIMPKKEKKRKSSGFIAKAPVTSSRLTELSLVVDTGGAYKSEEERERELKRISHAQTTKENSKTTSN